MSKELVGRELLERAVSTPTKESLEANQAAIIDRGRAQSDIRELLAQPAEAEGVEVVSWANEALSAFISADCKAYGDSRGGAAGIAAGVHQTPLVRQSDHLAALSAVTAERDRLREEMTELWKRIDKFQSQSHGITALAEIERSRAEAEDLRKDSARMDFMVAQRALIDSQNGTESPTVYRVCWPSESRQQADWYPSERDAIDAAMAAK